MKKTIAILLVAILTVGMVFADASFSGKFTSKLAYDVDENKLAFSEPDNALDLNFSLSTATENEGDVYAVVKGELTLVYESDKDGGDLEGDHGIESFLNTDDSKFEITEAAIVGNGWNLSILKAAEMPKYATGWETYNDGDDSFDLKAPYSYKDDYGVTFTMDGLFQAGFSIDADFDENEGKSVLAWAATNDLSFGGVLVNAAVGFGKEAADKYSFLGIGAQVGYATDTLSVKAGTDVTVGIPTEDGMDSEIEADVAVNVNYADMVVADVYYATLAKVGVASVSWDDATTPSFGIDYTYVDDYSCNLVDELGRGFITEGVVAYDGKIPPTKDDAGDYDYVIEDYLSAKVAFDMNAFDVPVKLTLAAMDVVNNPYFDLEAYAEVAGFEITGFGGYQALIDDAENKISYNNLHVGAKVAYTIEPVGKLSAATTFLTAIPTADGAEAENAMSLELALENTTLVSGATLKAGYKTANIIGGDNALFEQDKGEVYVSATIEF